jgi:hypothetical protein
MYLNDDQEELMDAVSDGNTRKVNALLKKGVDPNFEDQYRNTSPVLEAIRNDSLPILKALVAAGADVNTGHSTWDRPIDVADRQKSAKIIDYLESIGAQSSEPNRLTRQQQSLMDAIDAGDTRKVRALVDKGLDPDFADDMEATPLDEAIRRGSLAMVKDLVDAGADVNRVNSYKEAPLDVAKDSGDANIEQYLVSQGAVTGKTSKSKAHATFKKGRGRSAGFQQDFDDDYFDDEKYYFGADEDAGRKSAPKPKIKPKTAMTQSMGGSDAAPVKPPKPVFREDTLKDIFNAAKWIGKADEMEELWNEVPKRLQKTFDFAAALAEARRGTLKQNAPRIVLQNQNPQQNAPKAPEAAKEACDRPPAAPEPPKRA